MAKATIPVLFGYGGGSFGYTARYVSSVATGIGNGTTSSVTAGNTNGAWTLDQAMANAIATSIGMVIYIMDDGPYLITANKKPVNNGGNNGCIHFVGYPNLNGANANGGRPVINAQNNAITALGGTSNDRVNWEHLKIINAGSYGLMVGGPGMALDIQVTGCGVGIYLSQFSSRALFCECWGNISHGIQGASYSTFVMYCSVYNNGGMGIYFAAQSSTALFNIVTGNTLGGIQSESYGINVLFNTVYANNSSTGKPGLFMDHTTCLSFGNIYMNQTGTNGRGISVGLPYINFSMLDHFYGNNAEVNSLSMPRCGQSSGDPLFGGAGSRDFSLGYAGAASNLEIGTPFPAVNPFHSRGAVERAKTAPISLIIAEDD